MEQIRDTVTRVLEELEKFSLVKPISFEFIFIDYSNIEQTIPQSMLASGVSIKPIHNKKSIMKINFEISKNI
ncbi:MAG: hypothetical protein KHX83_09100 [Bilophila sp.]|uniref:hypothetical protein n=1 Tax=Bilophila sp. TaxID=1929485 RepID=UPI00257E781A|nr:hypothetical protein [Bilophila sp.]MBS5455594.1 hypothetical protein [Bilophila sp.]